MQFEPGSTRLRTVGIDEIVPEEPPHIAAAAAAERQREPEIDPAQLSAIVDEINGRAAQVQARERAVMTREAQAAQMINAGLRALTQRTIVALSNLFSMVEMGLVFWLWYEIAGDPSSLKLGAGAAFSTFVVILEYIRRRK